MFQALGTVKLLIRGVVIGIIVFIDHAIFEILNLIKRHSHIEYKQKGKYCT